MESLSVVIPTFNRREILQRALEGYFAQSAPQAIRELIVVDDGSTDNTEHLVRDLAASSPFEIRYLRQMNKGPAAARNRGILEARAPVILFTDSDIIPDRELVREHLEWHSRNPNVFAALLGYVTWPTRLRPTPFMRWYGEHGALFGFRELQGTKQPDFRFFYTCNISLKTQLLRTKGLFDEEFKLAAYEDTELGFRLEQAGMRLSYNPDAIAFHDQFFSFDDACRKVHLGKQAADLFAQKMAGTCFRDLDQQRRSNYGYRLAKWLADSIEPALRPMGGLLDSQFPLPSFIYRLFWYYGNRC